MAVQFFPETKGLELEDIDQYVHFFPRFTAVLDMVHDAASLTRVGSLEACGVPKGAGRSNRGALTRAWSRRNKSKRTGAERNSENKEEWIHMETSPSLRSAIGKPIR
jgi:hypothetical protein